MESWLTVIIVVLIVAIVLDGLRRMRLARRESIRLSRNARNADLEGDLPANTSEFPSGGARVAGYRAEREVTDLNQSVREAFEAGRSTFGASRRIPEQVSLNLEERVPMLMDSVDDAEQSDAAPAVDFAEPQEPEIGSLEGLQEGVAEVPQADAKAEPEADGEKDYQEPDEVLIMNVMAKSGQRFAGGDLLQALMDEGMKFGDMNIFHRHRDNDGDAPIVYSLANMVVPGTFNLAAMEDFETPGVSLFLGLPVEAESLVAYDDMATTAQRLAQRLGGELKDENRSVMTAQTIEHGRQRVIEYERKKKLARV